MFEAFSEEMQLIILIVIIALLFAIISWNTKKNKQKLYDRDKRNFRKNYIKKKQNKK